jgi:hypothetical protein
MRNSDNNTRNGKKLLSRLGLRRETMRRLSTGELSMVAAGTDTGAEHCPNYSCRTSCPVNTGGEEMYRAN